MLVGMLQYRCSLGLHSYVKIVLLCMLIGVSVNPVHTEEPCPIQTFRCDNYIEYISPTDENNSYTMDYDDEGLSSYSDYGSYPSPSSNIGGSGNNGCLPVALRCNGVADCSDCSDEKNCSINKMFWCATQGTDTCIPSAKRCDNHTDCADGSDECDCEGSMRCNIGKSNKLCVPSSLVCDGKPDCYGREDEINERCDTYECPSTGKRIMLSELCDEVDNCLNDLASDECNCSFTFVCGSGECIHNRYRCNGKIDCIDGSDECDCFVGGKKTSFRCHGSHKCIDASRVCDGTLDCGSYLLHGRNGSSSGRREFYVMDCSDEFEGNCSTHFQCADASVALATGEVHSDLTTCVSLQLKCDGSSHCNDGSDECECIDTVHCPAVPGSEDNTNHCILRRNFCDSVSHCGYGQDEKTKGFGFKCRMKSPEQNGLSCMLPQSMIDDGFGDCTNDDDICFRNGTWRCFQCFDQSMVISMDQVCDKVIDCPDLSDECACASKTPDLCDVICANDMCQLGSISCSFPSMKNDRNVTIFHNVPFSRVCDGDFDCISGEDGDISSGEKLKHLDEDNCGKEEYNIDQFRCPLGGTTSKLKPLYATRCDQRPECAGFADECDPNDPCEIVPEFCKNVSASVDGRLRGERRFPCAEGILPSSESDSFGLPGALVCDGRVDCAVLGEDEEYCPQRFRCRTVDGRISIDYSQKCDGRIDCTNQKDEISCPEYFYCENGEPLFVSKTVRFDGNDDCSDQSDECPKEQLEGTFASSTDMIASPFLKVLVWVMAAVSIVGNTTVIIYQLYVFYNTHKLNHQKVAMCNRVMLLNLGIADLLTGIYLLLLGIYSVLYSGEYCHNDKLWRTSSHCANLGFLNSIATEAAVVVLVIMTSYRLCAVLHPFQTSLFSPHKIAMICAAGWVVVIITMALPRLDRLSDYFCGAVWFPLPFFDSDIVQKSDVLAFIKKYLILTRNLSSNADQSWNSVESFVKQGQFSNATFVKFGYYSKHSVCIPNMLASASDSAVVFSAAVTIINLAAFLYVVVAYIVIYKGAVAKVEGMATQYSQGNSYVMRTQSTRRLTSNRTPERSASFKAAASKNIAMQARIFRLVVSNLACWLPLTLMALLKLFGVALSDETYAIAAIVLLPITSALNPLLYSNFISIAWEYLKSKACSKSKDESRTTQEQIPFTEPSMSTRATGV